MKTKMKYFKSASYTDKELTKEFRRLSKLHHPDVNEDGDDTIFKAVCNEYSAIKLRMAEQAEDDIDFNAVSRNIANIITEALGAYREGLRMRFELKGDNLDAVISEAAGIKVILAIKDIIEDIAASTGAIILYYLAENDTEMTKKFPIRSEGQWTFMSRTVPKSLGKSEEFSESKGITYMSNKKYSWAVDTKNRHCYVFEGPMSTLKRILK